MMVGLSEKAKGKQRAVEPVEGAGPPATAPREVRVRFTEGIPDLSVVVVEHETVKELKTKIRTARPQAVKRRLRLIYSGRLLTDDTVLIAWVRKQEDRSQKGDALQGDGTKSTASESPVASPPIWLHCSVGAEIPEGEEEDKNVQTTQLKPLRGFDRLAAAGFSEEDIAAFRRTFHNHSNGNYLDAEPLAEGEDYDEHARILEEQWIDSLENPNNTSTHLSNNSTVMMQGVLIGFFFPIIPFFFLSEGRAAVFWEDGSQYERPSSSMFSRRMQIYIIIGFFLNCIFGLWRYLLINN